MTRLVILSFTFVYVYFFPFPSIAVAVSVFVLPSSWMLDETLGNFSSVSPVFSFSFSFLGGTVSLGKIITGALTRTLGCCLLTIAFCMCKAFVGFSCIDATDGCSYDMLPAATILLSGASFIGINVNAVILARPATRNIFSIMPNFLFSCVTILFTRFNK